MYAINTVPQTILSFDEQCRRLLRGPRVGNVLGSLIFDVAAELDKLNFACPSSYQLQHLAPEEGASCCIRLDIGDRFADARARNYRLFVELSLKETFDTEATISVSLQLVQYTFAKGSPDAQVLALFEGDRRSEKSNLGETFGHFLANLREHHHVIVAQFRTMLLESIAP